MCSMSGGARKLKRLMASSFGLCGMEAQWIEEAVAVSDYRGRRCYWTPFVMIMTFLRQILLGNCSCRSAVAGTLSAGLASDLSVGEVAGSSFKEPAFFGVSGDPSAYAQARSRLPLAVFTALHRRIASSIRRHIGGARQWCGRRVFIADGSTIIMPDNEELQRAFPQPTDQKPGCGFPMARMTALFCWASGALLELAVDNIRVHELTLLRRMFNVLKPGDVLLGDRLFCSYVDIALLRERGIDSVTRLHVSRCKDMRKGIYLGPCDRLVEWRRPTKRPRHLTPEEWATVPETMTMRILRYRSEKPGFRSREVNLATTLLDSDETSVEQLAGLYRDRWRAELNLRTLKTTMSMSRLHTKSPDMVRKEVAMYVVGYNLIRWIMWQAAERHDVDPARLSHAGTLDRVMAMLPYLQALGGGRRGRALYARLLAFIASDRLPNRPGRIEPRRVKRRHNRYLNFWRPRSVYRKRIVGMAA